MSETRTDDAPVAVVQRRGTVAPYIAVAVAVILALFVWLLASSKSGDEAGSSRVLGKVAPAIAGTGFRGDAFDLDRLRGDWVLVNFFSTTCIPCQLEHPELVALAERHAAAGDLHIVSITFDDRPANVRAFFEQNGGTWPVLLEGTGPIAVSYGVTAVPESYLVAPSGVVARKVTGGIKADDMDALITRLGGN